MTDRKRPGRRPDPRPMRLLLGAGAVAAMSTMGVSMVQPGTGPLAAEPSTAGSGTAIAGVDARSMLVVPDRERVRSDQHASTQRAEVRVRTTTGSERRRARARTRQSGG